MSQISKKIITTETVLGGAFSLWKKSIGYHFLFNIIYFTILIVSFYYIASAFGVLDEYFNLANKMKKGFKVYLEAINKLSLSQSFKNFYWMMFGVVVFLQPLNVGLYKITKKIDLGETTNISDLFSGYEGLSFFKYMSFYVFWFLVYALLSSFFIINFVWIFVTLFSIPLMIFEDKKLFEGISLSWQALKIYPFQILSVCVVSILFKYIGFIILIGVLVTYTFWVPSIYTLYKQIFTTQENDLDNL